MIFKSKWFKILIGIGFSAGLLIWIGFSLEWKRVFMELSRVSWWVFLPSIALFLVQMYIRALRWRYLLPAQDRLPLNILFDGITIGNLATYLLPLRAGEFIRPFVLTRAVGLPFPTGFASIIIERFFDLTCVLISFAIIAPFLHNMPVWVYRGATGLSVLGCLLFLFIIVASLFAEQTEKFVNAVLKIFPKPLARFGKTISDQVIQGAKPLRSVQNLFAVIFLSILMWFSTFLLFTVFLYLSPALEHSFFLGVTTTVMVSLAVAAPSAPGFLGVYQTGCLAAFALFGVNQDLGAVYAILTHAFHYIMVCGLGVFSLLRSGLNFRELISSTDKNHTGVVA
jgi:uncharacterized protein (TIRG00374 family)